MTTKPTSDFPGLEKAISFFGSLTEMARALGLSGYTVIQQWRYSGRVPPEYCPAIERLTGGEARCEELNDRIDWQFLRGNTKRQRKAASTGKAEAA